MHLEIITYQELRDMSPGAARRFKWLFRDDRRKYNEVGEYVAKLYKCEVNNAEYIPGMEIQLDELPDQLDGGPNKRQRTM